MAMRNGNLSKISLVDRQKLMMTSCNRNNDFEEQEDYNYFQRGHTNTQIGTDIKQNYI